MKLELHITTADQKTHRVELEGDSVSIGRAHGNDLSYPEDASLSRRQLRLKRDEQGWLAEDLGSKNGTLLNGVRIVGLERLHAGDRLSAGHLSIAFIDPESTTPPAVQFVPGVGPDISPEATVMTSLEGLLSGETTAPAPPGLGPGSAAQQQAAFASPVVAALVRAGRELAGRRPLEELFPLILDLSISAVGAERGVVMTLEGQRLVSRAVHGEGFQISTTVRDRVIKEKASILVRDLDRDEAFRQQASIFEQQIHTMMAVPLQTEDRVIGLIYVDSRSFVREFTPDDLNLLTVLANVAAIRIEHERFSEMELREQRRTLDLQQAAEIQRGILPDTPPVIPGIELAGHNAACQTVGGDYYDFIVYPEGRVAVILGDVAGKGMSAAMLMSNLQARVQTLAQEPGDLARLMASLDKGIAAHSPANRFITLFMGLIDSQADKLNFCSAGHNPALLIRDSGDVEWLRAGGTVLGIMPELGYEQSLFDFRAGDLLAIYSDGVSESESPDGEEFGEERLAKLLIENRDKSAASIVETVLKEVETFTKGAPPIDDVTLVIARRTKT